jgi:hypothetical protein
MNDYIILLRNSIGALHWTGEGTNAGEAFERFIYESPTFDPAEKRDDFTILQVTRDELIAVEALG